jgi:hypothetical protein
MASGFVVAVSALGDAASDFGTVLPDFDVAVSAVGDALSDFGTVVSDFEGALALGVVLSGDFIAALPDLFAFARQASFSAAGRFAHAFAASLSPFAGAAIVGLSVAGAAAG